MFAVKLKLDIIQSSIVIYTEIHKLIWLKKALLITKTDFCVYSIRNRTEFYANLETSQDVF